MLHRLVFFTALVLTTSCLSEQLYLLTWDARSIERLRADADLPSLHSPEVSASLLHLWKETEKDLAILRRDGFPSVTDKHETVPGADGDMTYYVSVVPYAFPCNAAPPDCKDYSGKTYSGVCSTDGLPWIICDGEINAAARDATDRPKLERLMTRVMRLSLSGFIFRDVERSAAAARMLRVWFLDPETAMRPSLRFGQGIPGVTFGRSSACMDLYFSGRGFVDAVLLLNQTPDLGAHWTLENQRGIARWAAEMATYMATSAETVAESRMPNNHGTFFDLTVLSLAVLGGDPRSRALVGKIAGDTSCWTSRGEKSWCLEGRFASQVDDDGVLVHEVRRADPGHYVWYTLLANAYLATAAASVGYNAGFSTPHLRRAADWALPYVVNGRKARIAGRFVYAVQAYRLLARATRNETYEHAVCEVLTSLAKKSQHRLWSTEKVGVDILTLVMPSIEEAENTPCGVWAALPKLERDKDFLRWRSMRSVEEPMSTSEGVLKPRMSLLVAAAFVLTLSLFSVFTRRIPWPRKFTRRFKV